MHARKSQMLVVAASLLMFCLVGLTACKRERPLIYVIPRTTATLFWESLHNGALQTARREGYRIYWNAATREDDVGRQLALLEQARKRQPAGLIFAPSHGPALLTEVHRLLNIGLPTVIVESRLPIPSGPNLMYIVTDHTRSGRELAQRAVELSQNPRVALIGFDPDIPGHTELLESFADELAMHGRGQIISKQFSRFNRQQTEEQVEALLKAQPDVDVVLSFNPASTAGALDALHRQGRTHRVHLLGCDQDVAQIEPLRSGEIDALVVQDTFREGQLAVQAIAYRRREGRLPASVTVPARLISGQDLNDPEVIRLFSLAPRDAQ